MLNNIKDKILKQKNNLNTIAKIIALLLPFSILIYLGVKFYNAKHYEAVYKIDFNEENFKNTELPLYIDELQNSPKFSYFEELDGETIARVEGSPISFIWQPEEFPLNKTITVSMILQGDGDWDISLVCPNCEKKEKYDWQSFYQGSLSDYTLAGSFDGINIYARDNKDFLPAGSVEEWLRLNASASSSIEIKNEVFPESKLVNPDIDYKKNSWTEIDKSLRGIHQFYVYLKNNIDLEIIKMDSNRYEGEDILDITLYDLDNNIINEWQVEDDGIDIIDKNKVHKPVKKIIKENIVNEGVYKLQFKPNNDDMTIKYIRINTNKIIFTGKTHILSPATFYTEVHHEKNITFYAWHSNAIQTIDIKGEKNQRKIKITDNELKKENIINLKPDNYNISMGGDQKLTDFNFSLSRKNYFNPFLYNLEKNKQPNIIITKSIYNKNGQWIEVKHIFTKKDFKNIKNNKMLFFSIKNEKMSKEMKKKQNLKKEKFYPLASFNQYILWGRNDLKSYSTISNTLAKWIDNATPDNANIYIENNILNNILEEEQNELKKNIKIKNNKNSETTYLLRKNTGNIFIKNIIINIK